ncbi:MAG: Lrp/AsnC family transcriptional regulator [Anaerolineaceae bacterium]|nr:Lrp/AsnC family transcriptional regulator [Anaerolineaceae bacterium]
MTSKIKNLDQTGRKILSILQNQARLSFSKIGAQVGLSGPAVAERVKRFEQDQIITGYTAAIDANAAGLPIHAYLRLQTPAEKYSRVIKILEDLPQVLECHHITGDDAFLIRIAAATMFELEHVIGCVSPYGTTSTSMILSSPIDRPIHILQSA